ncbi:MAG TPA: universal stress protein, partial [Polyangiaceae bacterium]
TRGLMELIVLNIGLDLGVISPALFAIMVIMALVTTFMTTPLLQVVYPIEEIATQLAGADERSGPQSVPGYTALLCVAYEQSGPPLLTIGAAIAGKRVDGKSHSKLYALRLVRPADRPSFLLDQRESGGEVVENDSAFAPLMQRAEELEVDVHPLSFVSTEPGKDIRDVANVKKADIILLGWHKPMVGATMLSGTVHEVMTGATADVGVLVDRGLLQVGNLLVPYLGLEHDRAALRIARRIAENTGATATILHVVSPSGTAEKKGVEARVREEFVQGEGASRYKVIFKVVPHEVPAEAVVEESNQGHDLMIIGLGKQWGLEHRSFGLLPETILKRSPISVLVLRGPSAPEPVPAASSKTRPRLASVPPTAHASESKG